MTLAHAGPIKAERLFSGYWTSVVDLALSSYKQEIKFAMSGSYDMVHCFYFMLVRYTLGLHRQPNPRSKIGPLSNYVCVCVCFVGVGWGFCV